MDDCFEFMGEPEYGFRVNVTVTQECPDGLDSPADSCKTMKTNSVDLSESDNTINIVSRSYNSDRFQTAFDRQTGQDFASDAPPDCRVIDVC